MSTVTFLIAAGVAVLVAVLFVVMPLVSGYPARTRLRRQLAALDDLIDELDPHDYTQRRRQLRAELAGSGGTQALGVAVALTLVVPVATWLLYQNIGEPEGLTPTGEPVEQLRAELTEIARSLERNPDDADTWARMGMAYKNIREFSSAEHAFRRSLYLDEDNPAILVELAETLMFMGDARGLPEQARQLLTRTLAAEPRNRKALWLMGIGAFQAGDYERAIVWWQHRLLPLLAEGTSLHGSIAAQIAQARIEMGQDPGDMPGLRQAPPLEPGQDRLPPGHPPTTASARLPPEGARPVDPDTALPPDHPPMEAEPPSAPATADAAPRPGFAVDLAIAPELADTLDGNETVFIIARAANGPSAPLAVRRITVADLPARLSLSDRHAMIEGMNLSNFPEVVVTARVSLSGGVEARPGDLQGQSGVISIHETPGTSLTISERL